MNTVRETVMRIPIAQSRVVRVWMKQDVSSEMISTIRDYVNSHAESRARFLADQASYMFPEVINAVEVCDGDICELTYGDWP